MIYRTIYGEPGYRFDAEIGIRTMAKKADGLTARQVATIKRPGFHAAGGVPGLMLQVTPGGRSWVYRYQVAGKRRNMGLGSVDDFGLAEARERAAAARRLVIDGRDPID